MKGQILPMWFGPILFWSLCFYPYFQGSAKFDKFQKNINNILGKNP